MPTVIETLRRNDEGTEFVARLTEDGRSLDVSAATLVEFVFKKPSNSTAALAASFVTNGANGKIRAYIPAGFLDEVGYWYCQAHIVSPSGNWHSESRRLRVVDSFS